MSRPIGYYVHHQGAGHRHRARAIASDLKAPCTLIGTFGDALGELDGFPTLDLPDDRPVGTLGFDVADQTNARPDAFHYAPLDHAGVRHRMAMLAGWIEAHDPALIVVDVSVEIALFARLMAVQTAVMRLAGVRIDTPHLEAFRSAALVIAPFPALFESPETPLWVRDKTFYAGFLTGSGLYDPSRGAIRRVAVVLGRGGVGIDASALNQAACETPDVAWHVYGPLRPKDATAPNLRIYGWQADIGQPLDDADAVIGGAGDGLLAEVVTRGKRFICLPEPRPFDEQGAKARVLADHDMAVVLDAWPVSSAWPAIFRQAEALDPVKLHALADPHAIADLAKALDGLAASVKKDA